MGTMLQGYDLALADFDQLEGCNEILNRTRPDVVRAIHDAYFEVGVDAVETNTFGANLPARRVRHLRRIFDLTEAAAPIARASADAYSTPDRPRWVLGSVGPGTKLPDAGPRRLRPAARRLPDPGRGNADRRHRRGPDRDLPGPAADQGRHAGGQAGAGRRRPGPAPVIAHVTVETTGTMLLGSEIGAALTALEPLGIDLIGLNCATGPAEMSEHLRTCPATPRSGSAACRTPGCRS